MLGGLQYVKVPSLIVFCWKDERLQLADLEMDVGA
jgi:hypothetical protein